jgi:dephospho-CoA kinase
MTTDEALKNLILERFGEESFTQDGQLNRSFLAKTVFSDPENTAVMNTLVHPAVKKDFTQWAEKQSTPYILKEAA